MGVHLSLPTSLILNSNILLTSQILPARVIKIIDSAFISTPTISIHNTTQPASISVELNGSSFVYGVDYIFNSGLITLLNTDYLSEHISDTLQIQYLFAGEVTPITGGSFYEEQINISTLLTNSRNITITHTSFNEASILITLNGAMLSKNHDYTITYGIIQISELIDLDINDILILKYYYI